MAEHSVGLDIGSFAVRAAEVSGDPGALTLHRFAQITLPPGAVVEGEIQDQAAVTAAIKELWRKGEFKQKKVVVGLANKQVKVRETDVPDLAPNDIRNALKFEAQEVLPFAGDDAVVDYVVQNRTAAPEGGEQLRILAIVAQREMVSRLIHTVEDAGLSVQLVDLQPFALLRALAPNPVGRSEAIVSVGAGLTNVVVHTNGVPRLVRMTPRAGAAVTENLTRALGVDHERAEALKRGAGVALADPQTAQAAEVIASELTPLVQEIQGSLDFFLTQPENDDVEINRVLLTGAGAKMVGLRARLATELRLPVDMASPLEYLRLGKTGLTDEQLTAAAATMAAPVGLAMAPMASEATKLTSLFPEEFHAAVAVRRQKTLVIAGVAALTALLGVAWGVQQTRVAVAQDNADEAEARERTLVAQVNKLLPFEDTKLKNDARRQQIQSVLATDVDMTKVLDRMVAAMPADNWINSVTIAAAPGAAAPGAVPATPGAAPQATLGTVTIAAQGIDQESAAHWITAMRALPQFADVWVPSVTKGQGAGAAGASTFSSNIVLSSDASSGRATRYLEGAQ